MMSYKQMLCDILNCERQEIDMLAETNIDLYDISTMLAENGSEVLDMPTIYREALIKEVWDEFYDYLWDESPDVDLDDFEVEYNGAINTRMYLHHPKRYRNIFDEKLKKIEDVMNMEFLDIDEEEFEDIDVLDL